MWAFRSALRDRGTDPSGRRWIFVAYDQLNDALGPLARIAPRDLGIVLVECPAKAARRPYHKQKLALVLSNLRHFAIEQAERGVAIRHVVSRGSYADALAEVAAAVGPLVAIEPAERELRIDLGPLVARGALSFEPHDGWLTTAADFDESQGGPPFRMDVFYRHVRKKSGILMQGDRPLGEKFSHDADNRRAWHGEPPAPEPPAFRADAITEEVAALVEERFARHPGRIRLDLLPSTARDAEASLEWFAREALEHFGPFEDAMSTRSRGLFHSRLSPLINLHRILPRRILEAVAGADVPLSSKEGFVRQLLGWREYMRHVHRATDGFREIDPPPARRTTDGGFAHWSGQPFRSEGDRANADDGAAPSHLGAGHPLPAAWWGERSGFRCLDEVVASVWDEGWSHHIARLMILSNVAALLDVDPRELTDWFWVAYVDAYDWVVEPNVLAMSTFATGPLLTTKPYVAGAGYVDKMSDYCGDCAFDPKRTCPFTPMYWAYLARHRARLEEVPRMKLPLASEARRSEAQRRRDAEITDRVRALLLDRALVAPERLAQGPQRSLFDGADPKEKPRKGGRRRRPAPKRTR
jgi:deoxyribodipyrimidine photolyase-related protein